jgi:hypothetical protein
MNQFALTEEQNGFASKVFELARTESLKKGWWK